MNPNQDSQNNGPGGGNNNTPQQRDATINVIRHQIDSLYGDGPVAQPTAQSAAQQITQQPVRQNVQPQAVEGPETYSRTHTPVSQSEVNNKQWKEYHSAWQDYYQKYYAAYYDHQSAVKESRRKEMEAAIAQEANKANPQAIPQHSPHSNTAATQNNSPAPEDITKNKAIQELRSQLLNNVKSRAEKVRKSRHFMPIIASLVVVLIFVFIQYNRVFIANVSAYISPGSIDPQNIVLDPSGSGVVSEEPRLIIPKINVDVPVLYDVGTDHNSQMSAMEKGVAHFPIPGANSHPGEKGNTVLSGHSSNDLFDSGDYKFIFAQLEKLKEGDTIYANYQGKRYTYVITKMEVVKPTQVDRLVYETDKPIMTLITCTPLGTSLNRLLVTAEQVSPSPTEAKEAPSQSQSSQGSSESPMPGNSATLFERMFGQR